MNPRIRSGLSLSPTDDPAVMVLHDRLRISQPLALSLSETALLLGIDGQRDLLAIARFASRETGLMLTITDASRLIARVDAAGYLDSAIFRAILNAPVREPTCIGCYPAEPELIHQRLNRLFTDEGGPGLPGERGCRIASDGKIRALLVPHMDFERGGVTYGWAFKEFYERSTARLIVIVGTSHYSPARFSLTRKDFRTPLGIAKTNQQYVDRLVNAYGDGLFSDPFAHLPEHSIELEVVVLQHLFGDQALQIVPLLVGSFFDCVQSMQAPSEKVDIARMVASLQQAEAAAGEEVVYIISGDLAHIGPKFGDSEPVGGDWLLHSRSADQQLLQAATRPDAQGYFELIARENDQRRICGLPPTWLTLATIKPGVGTLLHYGCYVHPEGHESVSFATISWIGAENACESR